MFLGSGAFAVPILRRLLDEPSVEVVGVVTAADRPAGRDARLRSVPVALLARERGLKLLQPTRLRAPDAVAAVEELLPDVGILADYGQIVPVSILESAGHGFLNVHPSLLPRHRGATPIQGAILAGDSRSGVSLFLMDAGLDTGPIVASDELVLDATETASELETRLASLGADLTARWMGPWLEGTTKARRQDEAGATLTRPLSRSDGRLDVDRPAAELANQVRAYLGWPGSYVETDSGRLVVLAATTGPELGTAPGTLVAREAGLALATGGGSLALDRVQLAGGRPMSGAELLRGRPALAGTLVGR